MEGVWQVAASFDTAGGMAKSVLDLALLSDVLLRQSDPTRASLVDAMQKDWSGISVGFVDIGLWLLPPEARDPDPSYDEQSVSFNSLLVPGMVSMYYEYIAPDMGCLSLIEHQVRDYDNVIKVLRDSGAKVTHPVYITPPEKWLVEGGTNVDDLMDDIMRSQARAGCEYYLRTLEDSKITKLQDIIDFNNVNPEKEFDEGQFTSALRTRVCICRC
jgi:amidase